MKLFICLVSFHQRFETRVDSVGLTGSTGSGKKTGQKPGFLKPVNRLDPTGFEWPGSRTRPGFVKPGWPGGRTGWPGRKNKK